MELNKGVPLMQRHRDITLERLEKFISKIYWTDCNLRGNLYKHLIPASLLTSYSVPNLARIPYAEAIAKEFKPAKIGDSFGPSWATVWFHVQFEVPASWKGEEVHFVWDSSSEALLWQNGSPIQGLNGGGGDDRRAEYLVTRNAAGGEKIEFYIEMACNEMFGVGNGGQIFPPNPNRFFALQKCELGTFDRKRFDILNDFRIIYDMAKHLPADSPRAAQALYVANEIVNHYHPQQAEDGERLAEEMATVRNLAKKFFADTNGSAQHTVSAVGHCHIDTAWLWPYAETKRKCARSWSTAITYMESYSEYVFCASQAQQFEWVKHDYPQLYQRIQQKVQSGQFVPTGGTWVEMDCNVPSGESLVRQFLYGQRFFRKEFGSYCSEFWLPDTFGYSAQLPQIVKGAHIDAFLTQKLSWNLFNKFPNHTFYWEGIDGSRVLTHFPPADTYNANADVESVLKSATNYKDKERSKDSLMLFGFGDGGGGPTPEMLEMLARMKDLDGVPKVSLRSPAQFFDRLRAESKPLLSWVGELYFELHRGTYTTQANTKRDNRRGEFLLRTVELLAVINQQHQQMSAPYPKEELDRMWKVLLLNQFHDVLPGSSIGQVYRDTAELYAELIASAEKVRDAQMKTLFGSKSQKTENESDFGFGVFNSLSWNRREVIEVPNRSPTESQQHLAVVEVGSMGLTSVTGGGSISAAESVSVTSDDVSKSITLANAFLQVRIASDGTIDSLKYKLKSGMERECVSANEKLNRFVLFDDVPFYWDAWDVEVYHLEKRQNVSQTNAKVSILERGPLRAVVQIQIPAVGKASKIVQRIILTATSARVDFDTEVEWHESHKFLKVEFPLAIRAASASYEIQYGHVSRATHFNTSWDIARFEVCAQKWADLSEYNFGVALLNDSKYGYATHGNVMRLSLLRSPKMPDPNADMGSHRFRYALLPHEGSLQEAKVIQQAYALNVPLLLLPHSSQSIKSDLSFFGVSTPNVIIEAVKMHEDLPRTMVVRVYEAYGSSVGDAELRLKFSVKSASLCDLLEEEKGDCALVVKQNASASIVKLPMLSPFQIVTLMLYL